MDEQLEAWARDNIGRNYPRMEESEVFIGMYGSLDFTKDPEVILQLGMAVALDKPMYFVVSPGMTILLPANMRKIATDILEADPSVEEDRRRVVGWIKEKIDEHP